MGAIDATAAPQAAAKYEIQSYPAIKLFKKGVFVEDYDSGNMKDYADAISNFLLRHLGQNPTEKAKKAWVDHYAALGLTKEASDDELKKAYRRLSRQYHPDKARRPHPPPPPRPPCPGCSCSCRCCCPAAPALTAAAHVGAHRRRMARAMRLGSRRYRRRGRRWATRRSASPMTPTARRSSDTATSTWP